MIKKFLIIFLFNLLVFSQNQKWNIFPSFYNILQIEETKDGVFFLTPNSILFSNLSDNNLNVISKINGLKGNIISTFKIIDEKLFIGYTDGVIDIYDFNYKSIKTIFSINKSEFPQKSIKNFNYFNNNIFIITDFGIVILDSIFNVKDTYTQFPILDNSTIYNIYNYNNLHYIVSSNALIRQVSGSKILSINSSWEIVNFKNKTISKIQKAIVKENKFYLQADNNLYLFRNDSLITITENINNFYIYNYLYAKNSNNIKIFSDNYLIDNKTFSVDKLFFYKDSLWGQIYNKLINFKSKREIIVNSPFSYTAGNIIFNKKYLWVTNKTADYSDGFYFFNTETKKWYNYSLASSHRIYHDNNDTIFVARWGYGARKYFLTNDSLIFIKDYTIFNTPFKGIDVDPNFLVFSDIKKDHNNLTWFISYISSNRIQIGSENNGIFKTYQLTSNPNATNFNSLYTDRFNNKWIGTDDNGLFLFNENNIPTNINVTTNDGLNNNFVTSLVLDNNNELWIGTKAGINIINNINNPKSSVRRVYGMRNQIINQILIDNANRKWVATKTGGLFLLSSDGNEIISNFNSTNSPLISDNVLSIALDNDKGILYISTEYGIFSYNTNVTKSSLNYNLRVYPNPYLSKSNETITIDGLVSNSIVKIYNLNMELVKELPQINSGKITWDGKDKDGNILNTGIYFIVASDLQNNVAIQKLAVIK